MVCKICGAEIPDEAVICDVCGEAVQKDETQEVTSEEIVQEESAQEEIVQEEILEENTADEGIVNEDAESETAFEGEADEENVSEEEQPKKRKGFLSVGIPLIIIAIIALGCAFYAFIYGGYGSLGRSIKNFVDSNKTVLKVEYQAVSGTANPYTGKTAEETVKDLKYFSADDKIAIDQQLYTYFLSQTIKSYEAQYASYYGTELDKEVFDEIYEQVFDSTVANVKLMKLLEDKADAADYKMSDERIEELREELKKLIEENLEEGQTYEESKDDVIRRLYKMSYDDFFEAYVRGMRAVEFAENHPNVSEEEMKEVYDQYKTQEFETKKVKHILLKTTDDKNKPLSKKVQQKKKKLAQQLADRINNGENMDELIKEYTEDYYVEGDPNYSGEYEVVEGQYVPEFEEWAMTHTLEDKAEVVKTEYGYHVMKISLHEVTSYEDAKKIIKRALVFEEASIFTELMEIVERNDELLNKIKEEMIGILPDKVEAPLPTVAPTMELVPTTAAQ